MELWYIHKTTYVCIYECTYVCMYGLLTPSRSSTISRHFMLVESRQAHSTRRFAALRLSRLHPSDFFMVSVLIFLRAHHTVSSPTLHSQTGRYSTTLEAANNEVRKWGVPDQQHHADPTLPPNALRIQLPTNTIYNNNYFVLSSDCSGKQQQTTLVFRWSSRYCGLVERESLSM